MRWTRRRAPEPRGRHRLGAPVPGPLRPVGSESRTPLRAGSGVHLVFRDGTALELAAGDPRIGAFRAVAQTLQG